MILFEMELHTIRVVHALNFFNEIVQNAKLTLLIVTLTCGRQQQLINESTTYRCSRKPQREFFKWK